jgi:MFS family permease
MGYGITTAALFISLAVGISVPGRFLYGWLADRFSTQFVMATVGIFLAAGSLALKLFVITLGWRDLRPIVLFALVQGLGIAGFATVLPVLVAKCFGPRNFGKIIGLVMFGFAIGTLLGAPISAMISDKTGSYAAAWLVCSAVAALSVVLALFVRPTALHDEFEEEPATV